MAKSDFSTKGDNDALIALLPVRFGGHGLSLLAELLLFLLPTSPLAPASSSCLSLAPTSPNSHLFLAPASPGSRRSLGVGGDTEAVWA